MLLVLGHPPRFGQTLREVDLQGLTVRETAVPALNRQLVAMGKDPISYLSHEALRLANGHTLILAPVERILTDVQGSGPTDVLGYMVLDLDPNFQIVWTWNAFDFLDPRRKALLGELCADSVCGPLRLGTVANDWIHANTIARTPDGNLLISMRHQDWIVKIDYRDGVGTGAVLWRLGREGDFTWLGAGDDPWPWFSHQHQVEVLSDGRIMLYDNANTRKARSFGGVRDTHSRGQVLQLDETARTATLLLNADLGVYSSAWGSAQALANGNYHFMSGLAPPVVGMTSESLEVLPDGTPNYRITWETGAYRSFRMRDIYSPP
jgi:arylsulfate sulfotransferase